LIKTGKKLITAAIAIFEVIPIPNNIIKNGARTIRGITCEVIIIGITNSINFGCEKQIIIIKKLNQVAMVNPVKASINVV
jgi:hypothetical protein